MPDISEKNFETTIESLLLAGGADDPEPSRTLRERITVLDGVYVAGSYNKRAPESYDKSLCLIPKDVLDFILITQPKEWDKLKKNAPNETESHFLNRLADEIKNTGHYMSCVMESKASAPNSTSLTSRPSLHSTPKSSGCIRATSLVSSAS